MAHFKSLGLYCKKMVVVLAKCVLFQGALKIQVSILFAFFSISLKSKCFASKGKLFSPTIIDCFFKNTFEIFI